MRFALILIIAVFTFSCSKNSSSTNTARVKLLKVKDQYRFTVNGEAFEIKGLAGSTHLFEAAKIGANTIRTYDTIGLMAVLDSAEAFQLKVVAGIWLPKSEEKWLYQDQEYSDKLSRELAEIGRKYKNHPALLSWCLGNELIFYRLSNFKFAHVYNQLLDSLRTGDPNHPIGTAFANFGQKAALNFALKIPDIDYLIINTFGRLPDLVDDMNKLDFLWSKPFLIGEFGENGPWETDWTIWGAPLEPKSSAKASILETRFNELPKSHTNYLGALAFNWGWRQEQTQTWFNVFSQDGARNALYYSLQQKYKPVDSIPKFPIIESLKIDQSFDANTFWFEASEEHSAAVKIQNADVFDSLIVNWSIRTEDWYFLKADTPPALKGLVISTSDNQVIHFKSPAKSGPYRLFVEIRDAEGNFATANLPFYVVQ